MSNLNLPAMSPEGIAENTQRINRESSKVAAEIAAGVGAMMTDYGAAAPNIASAFESARQRVHDGPVVDAMGRDAEQVATASFDARKYGTISQDERGSPLSIRVGKFQCSGWDYMRHRDAEERRAALLRPSPAAVELAARIVRDRERLSLAGICPTRERVLLMTHTGVSYAVAAELLRSVAPADESAPPAPLYRPRVEAALAMHAEGAPAATVFRRVGLAHAFHDDDLRDQAEILRLLEPAAPPAGRLDLVWCPLIPLDEWESVVTMGLLRTPLMGTDPKTWKWQQIAKVGTFRGHPSGPFELSPRVFDEIVSNFKTDDQPVQWDLQHASESPVASELEGADAQGWIHDLDNRGQAGLWALTEWSPDAQAKIDSGKFRFCSPAIVFKSVDRVTGRPVGARLTSCALTGSPFLAGMQPLAASAKVPAALGITALTSHLMTTRGLSYHAAQEEAARQIREEVAR